MKILWWVTRLNFVKTILLLIISQRILLYITKKYIMLISSAMITWKNGILKTGV